MFQKFFGSQHQEHVDLANIALYSNESTHNDYEDAHTPKTRMQTVPSELGVIIGRKQVIMHARHRIKGITYSTAKTHLGNSLILFYPLGNTAEQPVAASISYIYSVDDNSSCVLAVHRQLPLSSHKLDPLKRYPDFPARIYSSKTTETLEVVQPDWVICHFARWSLSEENVIVYSLSRVCCLLQHCIVVF